jgi:beta-lactam-binding protein with PASTA domain
MPIVSSRRRVCGCMKRRLLAAALVTVLAHWPGAALQALQDSSVGRPRMMVRRVKVPALVNHSMAEADTLLRRAGLRLVVIDSARGTASHGTVTQQSIPPDQMVLAGSAVGVTYSLGGIEDFAPPRPSLDGARVPPETTTKPVEVPDLTGFSHTGAVVMLGIKKLTEGPRDSVPDEDHAGKVVRQSPARGESVPRGTAVSLWYGYGRTVAVPRLQGSTPDEAARALASAELTLGKVDSTTKRDGKGQVDRQNPRAGSHVKPGTAVAIRVAVPPAPPTPPAPPPPVRVAVPNLLGSTLAEAKAKLGSVGLSQGTVDSVERDNALGTVVRQTPDSGDSVPPRSSVSITLAKPIPPVAVPNLVGSTEAAATAALRTVGLELGAVAQVHQHGGAGTVFEQNPKPGVSVRRGSRVAIQVAIPLVLVPVPPLIGKGLHEAELALRHVGLTRGAVRRLEVEGGRNTVSAQHPDAGTRVDPGAAVALDITVPQESVAVPYVLWTARARAESLLRASGLAPGHITSSESDSTPGLVSGQMPAPRKRVARGTPVDLQIAVPRRVVVPDVVHAKASVAESLLRGLPLRVSRVDSSARFWQGGVVLRQEPAGGTAVLPQTEVRVWEGKASWTGVLLVLGGLVAAGALTFALRRPPPPPPRTEPPVPIKPPLVGLKPHAVGGGQTIDAQREALVHQELDLTAHPAAGTQVVGGNGPFEENSP